MVAKCPLPNLSHSSRKKEYTEGDKKDDKREREEGQWGEVLGVFIEVVAQECAKDRVSTYVRAPKKCYQTPEARNCLSRGTKF